MEDKPGDCIDILKSLVVRKQWADIETVKCRENNTLAKNSELTVYAQVTHSQTGRWVSHRDASLIIRSST